MRVEVRAGTAAPRARVWEVLTDWERQPSWMVDAREVEVLTASRRGVGVVLRCPTDLLGLVVEDRLRVTGWDPPARLEMLHLGRVISGRAAFELEELGEGTRLTWWEEVRPPLGPLGRAVAAVVVAPLTRRVFRRSLANLVAEVEDAPVS